MRTFTSLAVVLLVGVLPAAARAQPYVDGATQFVQQLADEAIAKLTDPSLTRNQREDEFRRLLNDNFAIQGIGRFMLGRYWRRATPAQREEYLRLYQDVLAATWAGPFSRYQGMGLTVLQAIPTPAATADENAVLVTSLIDIGTDSPLKVGWRVANKGDIYKIADVLVEGISMVTTQRDEFVSVIRANGGEVEGLLTRLREQHANARARPN